MGGSTDGARSRRPAVVLGLRFPGLALVRSLGRAGVPVSGIVLDVHDFGRRSRHLRRSIVVGGGSREERDDAVVAALRELAADARPVLFPEQDEHVSLLLRRWDEIRELADVPLPDDAEVVRRLARKDVLPLEAEKAGVAAPATVFPDDEEAVRAADLGVPFLVKPIESQAYAVAFGHKAVVAADADEAVTAWRRAHEAGFEMVLQELVPDAHERVFSLLTYIGRAGEPLASLVGRKVRQGPVDFGSSTFFETTHEPRVLELGHRLLLGAGYRGIAHVEFAHDARDGTFKLLEVNTRLPVWAGIALTPRFDLGRIAYADLCGDEVQAGQVFAGDAAWIYLPKDAWVALQLARRGELRPRELARHYARRRKVAAVVDRSDLRPVLGCAAWMRSRLASKLARGT